MRKKIFLPTILITFSISFLISFTGNNSEQVQLKIKKEGDVEVISNPRQPIPKNGLKKRIIFDEELSIGQVEGDDNYMFSGLISFSTDRDGNFYVSDHGNLRILKYNPEGKHLLTFGRKGQGPGEFQSMTAVRFDKDDNLYIGDVTSRRICFFNKEGNFLRQINMPSAYENIFLNSKDFIVASKEEQKPESNALNIITILGLFDQTFNTLAELHRIEKKIELSGSPGRDMSARLQIMANMINLVVFQPYIFLTSAENDFIYVGYPEKYEINIYSPQGKLIKKIEREYDPVPVSKKDIKNTEEELSVAETIREFPEELRKELFKLIKYPKYKPAYQSFTSIESSLNQCFTLLENGWLAVIADYVKNEFAIFDLFDEEGRNIAQFKTSIPVEGLFFNNGKAYAVATDEGYKFVKRYNIKLQEYKNNKWIDSDIQLK